MLWPLALACLAASFSSDPSISFVGDVCSAALPGGGLRVGTARAVSRSAGKSARGALPFRQRGSARVSELIELIEQLPMPPPAGAPAEYAQATEPLPTLETETTPSRSSNEGDRAIYGHSYLPRTTREPRRINAADIGVDMRPQGHYIVGRNIEFEFATTRGVCDLVTRKPRGAYACVIISQNGTEPLGGLAALNDQVAPIIFLGSRATSVGLPTHERLNIRVIVH